MKIRYSLPVRGMLRVVTQQPLELHEWTFRFVVNPDTGYVDKLDIEILNVPQNNWPTLTEIKQTTNEAIPRFPFDVNKEVLRFKDIEPHIITLESYLGVHGLESIDYETLSEEWIPEKEEENVSMFQSWSLGRAALEPVAEPLTRQHLARCIVASNTSDNETVALAFFRVGQMLFLNHQYIDAIRNFYFCLEILFANGNWKKEQTIAEFQKSQELTSAVSKLFFSSEHRHFEKIKNKYAKLKNAQNPKDFFHFLFKLRGGIQHTHTKRWDNWHPSRQLEFESEAICLINLTESICEDIVMKKMRSVCIADAGNS